MYATLFNQIVNIEEKDLIGCLSVKIAHKLCVLGTILATIHAPDFSKYIDCMSEKENPAKVLWVGRNMVQFHSYITFRFCDCVWIKSKKLFSFKSKVKVASLYQTSESNIDLKHFLIQSFYVLLLVKDGTSVEQSYVDDSSFNLLNKT